VLVFVGATLLAAGCGRDSDSDHQGKATASTTHAQTAARPSRRGAGERAGTKGPLDPRANIEGAQPSRGCERLTAPGAKTRRLLRPPVPALTARRLGSEIVLRWSFRSLPRRCRPGGILLTANSVRRLTAVSGVGPAGRPLPVRSPHGEVRVPVPAGGAPPYEARVSTLLKSRVWSRVITVPVH
jgi:hypothetical protein